MDKSIKILFFICLIGIAFACESTSEKNETEVMVDSSDLLDDFPTKLDLVFAQKSEWYEHWAQKLGRFEADDFELMLSDTLEGFEMPEKNPILPSDPLFPYQFPHPGGNGVMDIYSYKIEAQDELDSPFLNPDSEVVWYKADGMKERLLFMGPSGAFEEGLWLSEEEFLVLGFFQEVEGFRPLVWLIRPNENLVYQFRMKKVTSDYKIESYLNKKIKKVELI